MKMLLRGGEYSYEEFVGFVESQELLEKFPHLSKLDCVTLVTQKGELTDIIVSVDSADDLKRLSTALEVDYLQIQFESSGLDKLIVVV